MTNGLAVKTDSINIIPVHSRLFYSFIDCFVVKTRQCKMCSNESIEIHFSCFAEFEEQRSKLFRPWMRVMRFNIDCMILKRADRDVDRVKACPGHNAGVVTHFFVVSDSSVESICESGA